MDDLTVGEAAARTGWSARMLRYLEQAGLVVPRRTKTGGYRLYGLRELNQLRSLRELRRQFGVEISDLAFAARLRREPSLRSAVDLPFTLPGGAMRHIQRESGLQANRDSGTKRHRHRLRPAGITRPWISTSPPGLTPSFFARSRSSALG